MKTPKEFDCVDMKTPIQERLLLEVGELGEEEAQRRREERLSQDPILSTLLRAKMGNGKMPGRADACRLDFKSMGGCFA